jgi:hypothetical protein
MALSSPALATMSAFSSAHEAIPVSNKVVLELEPVKKASAFYRSLTSRNGHIVLTRRLQLPGPRGTGRREAEIWVEFNELECALLSA